MEIKYGTDIKIINITEDFTKLFIKNNNIIIPKNTSFNHYFGDPLPNIVKNIYLIKDNYLQLIISENEPYEKEINLGLDIDNTFDQSELVSVIIPTYNRFTYLLNTIKSIKSQTYKNIEIIVVNDCSGQSEYYSYNWKEHNIKIIHLPENSKDKFGYPCVGYVINQGLNIYKGIFFSTCDDDDIWLPRKLELQIKALRDSGYKMSCTEGLIGNGPYNSNKLYKKYNEEYYYDIIKNIYNSKNSKLLDNGFPIIWNLEFLKIHNCIIACSVIIHKDVITKIGKQLEIKMGGQEINNKVVYIDYDFWLRALQYTDCIYIKNVCFYYDNSHGGGQQY